MATPTSSIVTELLAGAGIDQFSTDPTRWGEPIELQFGNRNGREDISDLYHEVRDILFERLNMTRRSQAIMGLYAIYNTRGNCLYLGKSKDLYKRIYRHYQTSVQTVSPNRDSYNRYIQFFRDEHAGTVRVYWLQVQFENEDSNENNNAVKLNRYKGETLRIILERTTSCNMLADSDWNYPIFERNYPSQK